MTSKADELPMDMEPVAHDNNTIFMLKLGDQTFVPPYSTDNRSKLFYKMQGF